MNYQLIYDRLITKRQGEVLRRGYIEKHHIIPRCLGGDNQKSNIVRLTAEEHFLAHQLLAKIHSKNHCLIYAVVLMSGGGKTGRRINNKMFGWLRRKAAEANSMRKAGTKASEETRRKISLAGTGRITSEETKKKLSAAKTKFPERKSIKENRSKQWSEEHKGKLASAQTGSKKSEATKAKIAESIRNACRKRNDRVDILTCWAVV